TGEDAPAALALDAGADTLIWTVGDHRDLVGFARGSRECREAVAAERRARGTRVRPIVPAKVRRLRRAGIDYGSVPAELEATAEEPGDPGFSAVRSTYIRSGNPGLVLRPATTAEVQRAIGWPPGKTCRSRCDRAGTGSPAARRTTAASWSTSPT